MPASSALETPARANRQDMPPRVRLKGSNGDPASQSGCQFAGNTEVRRPS